MPLRVELYLSTFIHKPKRWEDHGTFREEVDEESCYMNTYDYSQLILYGDTAKEFLHKFNQTNDKSFSIFFGRRHDEVCYTVFNRDHIIYFYTYFSNDMDAAELGFFPSA